MYSKLILLYLATGINTLALRKPKSQRIEEFDKALSELYPDYDTDIFEKRLNKREVDPDIASNNGGNDIKNWDTTDETSKHFSTGFKPEVSLRKNRLKIDLRPDIYSLTKEQRQNFIDVIYKLNSGPRPTTWDQITKLHILNYQYVHLQPYFFAWHRAFIYKLEEAMKEIDPDISLPYWDWTEFNSLDPMVDPIFKDDYFGGNGDEDLDYCLTTGPFRYNNFSVLYEHDKAHQAFVKKFKEEDKVKFTSLELNMLIDDDGDLTTLNKPKCVKRMFRPRDSGYMGWNDRAKMNSVVSNDNPIDFWHFVERGGHGYVHNTVGSERATDPLFFVLHAFVDKLWFDWQNRNPDLAYKYPVKAVHLDMKLNPFGATIRELLDPVSNMGYGYSQQRYSWDK